MLKCPYLQQTSLYPAEKKTCFVLYRIIFIGDFFKTLPFGCSVQFYLYSTNSCCSRRGCSQLQGVLSSLWTLTWASWVLESAAAMWWFLLSDFLAPFSTERRAAKSSSSKANYPRVSVVVETDKEHVDCTKHSKARANSSLLYRIFSTMKKVLVDEISRTENWLHADPDEGTVA